MRRLALLALVLPLAAQGSMGPDDARHLLNRAGFGAAPRLDRLKNGNLAVEFRSLYATVLERWWSVPSSGVLGGRFPPLDLLKS
jgi:hypothetical protein